MKKDYEIIFYIDSGASNHICNDNNSLVKQKANKFVSDKPHGASRMLEVVHSDVLGSVNSATVGE